MSLDLDVFYKNMLDLEKIMDNLKVPWCLTASTLLGVYRDNQPIGGIQEIDYLADFMTDDKYATVQKLPEYGGYSDGEKDLSKQTIWYFDKDGARIEVQAVYFVGDVAYKNLVGNDCLIYPKDCYGKFKTKVWQNTEWPIPEDTEKWLETYYGDWKVKSDFNWNAAKNRKTLGDVLKIQNFEELMKL